jgi:hypothetical protein
MNAVAEIMSFLKTEIQGLLPDHKEIPFLYSLEDNDSQMDLVFGIRVGNASQIPGVTRNLTFSQEFIVDVVRKHVPKRGHGDKDLRDKILLVHSNIQKIYTKLSLRSGDITSGQIINISPVDISSPSSENGVVSVSLTLQVQYRVKL